jgi:hypothetical protein
MPAAPPIVIAAFSGEQPHILPRLMPDTAAQSAIDTRLDDGSLEPIRASVSITTTGLAATWKTIYNFLGTWIGWDNVVNAVPGPVASDRLYYTGDGVPKMRVGATIYNLALPYPQSSPGVEAPLVAALGGVGAGDIQTRVYVYTYVTSLGEESAPNAVSNSVDWKPGNNVTLSGFLLAPTGRGVTTQRIYRSQTGSVGTGFYLIAERPQSVANYVDTIAVDALQEPLPSGSYNTPPDDLEGLIALPNGMMAAFGGAEPPGGPKKKLYFSEPYKPHAWPEKYILTVDSGIVGLGAMGVSVVVATKAQPYMCAGTLPEAMILQKIEQNLPCINPRSIVDLGYAVAYASNEGLVVTRANGEMGLVTGNLFDREDWNKLSPATMISAQLDGRYVAFYDQLLEDGTRQKGALFIDVSGNPSFLFRSDTYAQAARYGIPDSGLYYMPPGVAEVRQLDAPAAIKKTLYWRSKEFLLPYPENYGAIMIDLVPDATKTDAAADAALVAQITAANQALITAGSIGGDIDGGAPAVPPTVPNTPPAAPIDSFCINGDMLTPLPHPTATTLTVGIYADDVRVASVGEGNRALRLPGGFKARKWEIDVYTNARIERIIIAKTMDDMKRTPP